MGTILDALKGVNAYPVPLRTIVGMAEERGVPLNDEATRSMLVGKPYKLAKADILMWLSFAPNITQGGQSYSFTDEQRQHLRNQAKAIYAECGDNANSQKPIYGYKGSLL